MRSEEVLSCWVVCEEDKSEVARQLGGGCGRCDSGIKCGLPAFVH
jgi:hypothetical protein